MEHMGAVKPGDHQPLDALLVTAQAAAYLGVSMSRFLRETRKEVRSYKIEYTVYYLRSDLDAYLRSRTTPRIA